MPILGAGTQIRKVVVGREWQRPWQNRESVSFVKEAAANQSSFRIKIQQCRPSRCSRKSENLDFEYEICRLKDFF